MIKFFRKIRQNLLSEGKTGKYFKYAVGEIVLVVIGILIALSINNWNEGKKTEALEKKLLNELIQSLETDIEGLQFVIQKNSEIMNQCIFIAELIEGKQTYNDSLNTYFYNAQNYYHHSFNKSAYETSKSHGLYFIKNDSARSSLSQLYEWQFEMNNNLRQVKNSFNSLTVEPFLADNFDFVLNDKKGLIPIEIETLLSNSKYKYIVNSSMSKMRTTLHWQNVFLDNIKQIQVQLKSELNTY